MSQLLAPAEIDAALAGLPGVHKGSSTELRVRLEAPSFPAAIELVDLVAVSAEEANHHPDIDVRWRTVTFGLSTHSAGGVTALDLDLARRILEHAAGVGAEVLPPA